MHGSLERSHERAPPGPAGPREGQSSFYVWSGDQRMRLAASDAVAAAVAFLGALYRRGRLYRAGYLTFVSPLGFDRHDGETERFVTRAACDRRWDAEAFEPLAANRQYTALEISRATGIPIALIEQAVVREDPDEADEEIGALFPDSQDLPPRFAGDQVAWWIRQGCPATVPISLYLPDDL